MNFLSTAAQGKMSPFFIWQLEGQSFHDFITKVKKLSAECEFENLRDSFIKKDLIVCGANNNAFRKRLLRESDLTLTRAINAGHTTEESQKYACEIMQSQSAADLHKINKLCKHHDQAPKRKSKEIIKKCKFCNGSHPREKCSAYGRSYLNSNRKTYFKVYCPRNQKKVHQIEETETDCKDSSNLESFGEIISTLYPLNINELKNESSVWSVTITSNGPPISYKIDTDAKCNVVPLKIYQKLDPQPDLHPVNLKISAYNNSEIPVIGKCSLSLEQKKQTIQHVLSCCWYKISTHSRIRIVRKSKTYQKYW